MVDSLHSWEQSWRPPRATEYEGLNMAIEALKRVAQFHDIPILVVAERNRASMHSGGQSAGAGTRNIEYGAESVIELDRRQDAPQSIAGERPLTLKVIKNRNGSPYDKGWSLLFNGELMTFKQGR